MKTLGARRDKQQDLGESSDFSFAKLLSPVKPNVFLRSYWEKLPLVVARKKPSFFANLISQSDLDFLLGTTCIGPAGFPFGLTRMKDGEVSVLEVPAASDQTPDMFYVYRMYHHGYTLLLQKPY